MLPKVVPKSLAPGGIAKLPPELLLCLRIRCASYARHHVHESLTHDEACDPLRHMVRRLGSKDTCKLGKPQRSWRGLIIDDVINAACTALCSQRGSESDILQMYEGPYTRPATDDRQLPASDELGDLTTGGNGGAWSIKGAIAQNDALNARCGASMTFELANRLE